MMLFAVLSGRFGRVWAAFGRPLFCLYSGAARRLQKEIALP